MFNELENILINVITADSRIKFDKSIINEECDLIDDLGFDSFLMVQLIIDIECEFDIEFDYEELDMSELRKYSKMKKYIISKIEE